jgi:hypothetical protein
MPRTEGRGYGPVAIALALVVGVAIGAFAVTLFNADSEQGTLDVSGAAIAAQSNETITPEVTPREVTEAVINPPSDAVTPSLPPSAPPPDVAPATQADAGLLVHSTPAGALVTVDGVPRGMTPVAVRGLEFGARTVRVARAGYRVVERQVVLTSERPSRTLEVQLSRRVAAPAAAVRTSGDVIIDSRPAGATVTVDGRRAGVTPLTLTLSAGPHVVTLERVGYRAITQRVVIKGGERTRVAARLEGGQDEE